MNVIRFANILRIFVRSLAALGMTALAYAVSPAPKSAVNELIPWLLNDDRQLRGIPFSEVIFESTGKRVLPVDRTNEVDQRVIKQIGSALDEVTK